MFFNWNKFNKEDNEKIIKQVKIKESKPNKKVVQQWNVGARNKTFDDKKKN